MVADILDFETTPSRAVFCTSCPESSDIRFAATALSSIVATRVGWLASSSIFWVSDAKAGSIGFS